MREITIQAKPPNTPTVLSFVEEFCRENAIIRDKLSRCLLICDEIFSNIIKYGETKESLVSISLDHLGKDHIRIIFEDEGIPFNPLLAQEPDSERIKNRTEGGLGIHLVKTLAESIAYEHRNGKNVLIIQMGK